MVKINFRSLYPGTGEKTRGGGEVASVELLVARKKQELRITNQGWE